MKRKKIGVREQQAIKLFKKATRGMRAPGEIESWLELPFVKMDLELIGGTNCWDVKSTGNHRADFKLGAFFAEHHVAHYSKERARSPMEMSPLPLGFVVRDMARHGHTERHCSIQCGYLTKLMEYAIGGLESSK